MTLPGFLSDFRDVLFDMLLKVAPAAVVAGLELMTKAIPVLLLWMTFIFTGLQLYVFVRDKLIRKKHESEI